MVRPSRDTDVYAERLCVPRGDAGGACPFGFRTQRPMKHREPKRSQLNRLASNMRHSAFEMHPVALRGHQFR